MLGVPPGGAEQGSASRRRGMVLGKYSCNLRRRLFLGVFPTADKSRRTRPGTANKGYLTPKERAGVPHPLFGLLIRHSFAESISNKEYFIRPALHSGQVYLFFSGA